MGAELDACDIAQAHRRAIRVGAQHNIGETPAVFQLTLDDHRGRHGLAGKIRQVANRPCGNQGVLGTNRRIDIGRTELVAEQLDRIEPNAHGALGAEQLRLADAGQTLEFRHDIARHIVAQRHRIQAAIGR